MNFAEIVQLGVKKSAQEILDELSNCSSNQLGIILAVQLFSKALPSGNLSLLDQAMTFSIADEAMLVLCLYGGYLGSKKGESRLEIEIANCPSELGHKLPFAVALSNLHNINGIRMLLEVVNMSCDQHNNTILACLDKCSNLNSLVTILDVRDFLSKIVVDLENPKKGDFLGA